MARRRNSLFNRDITLYRAIDGGYWTDDNEYVDGGEEEVVVKGSIQPYREGVNNFLTPAGFRAVSAVFVYAEGNTGGELIADDDRSSTIGDEIVYRGTRYKCIDLQDWTGHDTNGRVLNSNHMLGVFYQKDKLSEVNR